VLALTGLELIRSPQLLARAKTEFRQYAGGQAYRPPAPDADLDARLETGARR
jgi:hypothetical protein